MELHQKNGFFNRKSFKVVGNYLHITDQTSADTKIWTINLEHLGDQIYIEKKSKKAGIITGIFFLAFSAFFITVNLADGKKTLQLWAWVTMAIFFVLFGVLPFFIPPKNTITIVGGSERLTFFYDSPSHKIVMDFIEFLIRKSKEILKSKYGNVDPSLPEETAINQFNWLKNRNVISVDEFEALKKEYFLQKVIS